MRNEVAGRADPDHRRIIPHWVRRRLPVVNLTPLRITLAYTVLGFSALVLSDILLVRFLSDPLLSQLQAAKGGVEVLLTAGFILVVTNRREIQLDRSRSNLARQREELNVLHRVLRHNLRNDVNVIMGAATLVKERAGLGAATAHCETILDTAERMTHYTDQAKRIHNITQTDDGLREFDLSETIPALLERHPETDDVAVSTTIGGDDDVVVEANPMLPTAVGELVTNAIEHNDADAPALSLEVDPDAGPPGNVELRISDNGPGIPPSQLRPLRAGREEQLLHLDGMGLWFAEWTVRHSNGELDFEETADGGTTVVLRLPKGPAMYAVPGERFRPI